MNYPYNEILRLFLMFFLGIFFTSLVMKKLDKENWKTVFHIKSIITTALVALCAVAAYILPGKLF